MKIKYVGQKTDGEPAFVELTGITWMPEDAFDVKPEHAEHMLVHANVFELVVEVAEQANEAQPQDAELVAVDAVATPSQIKLPDGEVLTLDGVDKAALRALAKTHGVVVHHAAGVPAHIAALMAALPVGA